LYSEPTATFFDEHIIREDLLSEKKEQDANVEERIRNYKNFTACMSLTERMSKASEYYTEATSQKFISPFSAGGFDFNQLTAFTETEKSGFFKASSHKNLGQI